MAGKTTRGHKKTHKRNNYISENTKEIAISKAYQEYDKIAVDIIYTQQQTQESKERIAQKWNELKLGWQI